MPVNRDDVKGGLTRGKQQQLQAAAHAYRATGALPSQTFADPIATLPVKEPQPLTPAEAMAHAHAARANTASLEPAQKAPKDSTSYTPFFKGQQPTRFETRVVRGAPPAHIPVYELGKAGKSGQQGLEGLGGVVVTPEQAQAQLGTTPTLPMQILTQAVHPLTDLSQQAQGLKPFKAGGAASDIANIASNFVPVGKAAGILGFGLKGLKDLKGAGAALKVGIDPVTGKPLTEAGSLEAAVAHAKQAAAAQETTLTPEQQLRQGLRSARSRYGVEKAARKQEAAGRFKAVDEALATIKDPHEALAASGAALRGKYAQIDFQGLKELNPETVKHLMTYAQNHPTLGSLDKRKVMQAINAAVVEGRVPRPHEMRLIEMVFGKKTAAGLAQQATQNLGDKVINVINIPRALQTTLDISGLMRQNLVAGVSHPLIWGRNVPTAFKAMRPAGFEVAQQAVKENPLYPMALQAGVKFTDIGEHTAMLAHEEGFQSDIAANALDRIPRKTIKGKSVGVPNVIKASARSYVATGNAMKMGVFENRIRLGLAAGENVHDEKTLSQIAQVVNAATGRGTLPGRAEHLLPAMNTFLFSPRLMMARLQYMDPTWYFRLKGPARREALRGLFATAGSVTSALYLFSQIPGVEIGSTDPRSADFGKLKINNTRVDLAGGFQQYVRLAFEIARNSTVSSTTGKVTKFGSGYGKPTRWDTLTQFGINKLAPGPGLFVNLTRGHDAVGNPITWNSLAQNYLTPLTFQDAKDIYNEKHGGVDGITWAIGGYGLGSMGLGLQTYQPKVKSIQPALDAINAAAKSGQLSPERAAAAKRDLERVHYVQTHDTPANRRQFLIDSMHEQGYGKTDINAALAQLKYDPIP